MGDTTDQGVGKWELDCEGKEDGERGYDNGFVDAHGWQGS